MSARDTGAVPGSWSIDVDLPDWLAVPAGGNDRREWAAEVGQLFATFAAVDEQVAEELQYTEPLGLLNIDDAILTLLELSASLPENQKLLAGMNVPGWWPLPVTVAVTEADASSPDLLEVAGARGGQPIQAPEVEPLPEELGDGIRVTRLDLDDTAAIWATVTCAVRRGNRDVVVTWRTPTLELIPQFAPELENLLGRIRTEDIA